MEWKGHGWVGDAVERPWLGRRRGRGHDRLEWCRGILERRRRSVGSRESVCEIGEMETEREESGDGEHGLGVGTVWEPRCAGRPVDSPAKPLPPHAREVTAACHLHVQRKKKATGHRDGKGRGKSEQHRCGRRTEPLNHRIFYSREASGRLWSPQLDGL